jgi:hypothetical protein
MTETSDDSTPRSWQTGDPEPPDDVEVLSKDSEPGWFLVRGRPGWFWSHVGYRSERPGYSWSSVCTVGQPGRLTEVPRD